MSDHNIVLAVASYASLATAGRAFAALGRERDRGTCDRVAAVVVAKGPDGTLGISDGVEPNLPWAGAYLGAALTVLAAPVGIMLLPSVVTTRAGWARVAALVAHYWHDIPQEGLHQMTNLLEASPAGLVVVAVDETTEDIAALLPEATATIIMEGTTVDLGDDPGAA